MDKDSQNLKNQVDALERKLDLFIDQYNRNNNPTSQTFTKRVIIGGGLSLNGSSLGVPGDLMSVYGVAPVAQAAAITAPPSPSATYVQSEMNAIVQCVNNMRLAIKNFGTTA